MKALKPLSLRSLIPLLFLVLAGCSSPEPHIYVLTGGASKSTAVDRAGMDLAVGVGPVELPDYLDRRQVVTRSGQNELDVADFAHWAEPLKFNIPQVLVEELSALLPSKKVVAFPWRRATTVNYQVAIKIIRFEATDGTTAILRARWSIVSGDGKGDLLTRESEYSEPLNGKGYDAIVASMNLALLKLSRDIADALRSASAHPSPLP